MNWKQKSVWLIVSLLVFYYFLVFGVFVFRYQEESQLFIPALWNVSEQYLVPGGFIAFVGQFLIQCYHLPMFSVLVNTALLISVSAVIHRLLQEYNNYCYNFPLSLIPVCWLMNVGIRNNYLIDGNVALLLMLLSVIPLLYMKDRIMITLYSLFSTVLLFVLGGNIAIYYSIFLSVYSITLHAKSNLRFYPLASLFPALIVLLFPVELGLYAPFTEAFKPEEYLEIQLLPDYYINYAWMIFCVILLVVVFISFALSFLNSKTKKDIASVLCFGALFFTLSCNMPDNTDKQNRMLNELSFLSDEEQWDAIINKYKNRNINDYISLNYLNMALAKKGMLAENMFAFDQKGPKSLVAPWNRTLYMDNLLCDIHFMTGDLAMSESYALDAMTQSKRGGNTRALRRLVQINLLRGEYALAGKYIALLEQMPFYKEWADEYSGYLYEPERMFDNLELKGKIVPPDSLDNLMSLMTTEKLWNVHTAENRIGWEYLGCYYLLDKNLGKFNSYIEESGVEHLPRHFQEALLIEGSDSVSNKLVSDKTRQRFESFRKVMVHFSKNNGDVSAIYNEFGDTYWFYYYFKIFKNKGK
ncbi:MAG: DUF6057 family protein [Parabacteroides sp.]|nr:DUF6057 family protein [Parabacteroides sp.]